VLRIGTFTYLVDVSGAPSLKQAIQAYQADPRVRYAGADYLFHAAETPNDNSFGQQWGLTTIDAPTAWNRTHGVTGTQPRRIAILDSGINVIGNDAHPELVPKVIAGRDFTSSSNGADDVLGHGTHVAGIAAAVTNNGQPTPPGGPAPQNVAGVGYDAVLINAKVLDDNDDAPLSAIGRGIVWATNQGADVINMSIEKGRDCDPNPLEDVFDFGMNQLRESINYAWDRSVVLVAAAGNDGSDAKEAPAACPQVVAVANITQSGALATGNGASNFGDWVELAAPGTGILSTAVPGGAKCGSAGMATYGNCNGTSMAAPHVAGLAALVQASCFLDVHPQDVIDRMTSTASPLAKTAHGVIDASKAVCFPVPTGLKTGTITSNSIQVTWSDTTPAETRFEVGHRPAGGTFTTSTVGANTTSFTQSNLAPGSRHEFRVQACDNEGCSPWSNTIQAVVGGGTLKVQIVDARAHVTSSPAGINCGLQFNDCEAAFPAGTVELRTRDFEDESQRKRWEFDHWEGDCSGTAPNCTLTISGEHSVKAFYTEHSTGGGGGGGGGGGNR
jgi:thermitase